jgi:hypothetical protein
MDEEINLQGNIDINEALKEFEAKSSDGQIQKNTINKTSYAIPKHEVEGIKFDTDNDREVKAYDETDTPKIVKLVIKLSGGAIEEQKQAEYILLGFVIIAITVSIFLFVSSSIKANKNAISQPEINRLMNLPSK